MSAHRFVLSTVFAAAVTGCFGGTAPVGGECEEKEQCSTGLCFQSERYGENTGWLGGYCTEECTSACDPGAECVALETKAYCLSSCSAQNDCRKGYLCHPLAGACLPDCRLGFACGTQMTCGPDGFCVAGDAPPFDPDAPKSEMGQACTYNVQCETAHCIFERPTANGLAWKDGMCSRLCGECDEGFVCVQLLDAGVCLPGCTAGDDCRDGYICNPDVAACLPDCRLGFECGPELICSEDGACLDPDSDTDTTTDGEPIGAPCETNQDCTSGTCIPQTETATGQAWLDGTCSQTCGTCPEGSRCQVLGDESWCLGHCAADGDCREGYVCSLMNEVCLPDCRLGFECGPELSCSQRGLCTGGGGGGGGPGPGGRRFL